MNNIDGSLVKIVSSIRMRVDPIWVTPIDDIEGPLYQEYITQNPEYTNVYVRPEVRNMINAASQMLPDEFRLIVRAGHRPLAVQYRLLDMVKQKHIAENPGVSEEQALQFARTFVSDPRVKLPPHCCGAAVDVDVEYAETSELVDFGCPMNTDDDIAFLDSDKITPEQRAHRTILVDAMVQAGFAPNPYEWWHFSYRDETWRSYYGKQDPLYQIIEV